MSERLSLGFERKTWRPTVVGRDVVSPLKSIVHFCSSKRILNQNDPTFCGTPCYFVHSSRLDIIIPPATCSHFCPHVSIGLCDFVSLFFLFFLVGKAGLVSCLEFTFSISLMVVVAWKSIVLCAEPTKICSRHRGGGVFIFLGGVPSEKKALVYWELTVTYLCYLRGQVSCLDGGGRDVCNWPKRKEDHLKFATPRWNTDSQRCHRTWHT